MHDIAALLGAALLSLMAVCIDEMAHTSFHYVHAQRRSADRWGLHADLPRWHTLCLFLLVITLTLSCVPSPQVTAINAFTNSSMKPLEGHCIDTWTMAKIKVPVGGLVPYPKDIQGQNAGALDMPNVIITPISMLTVGDFSSKNITDKYNAAYAKLHAAPGMGQYGQGAINSGKWVRQVLRTVFGCYCYQKCC